MTKDAVSQEKSEALSLLNGHQEDLCRVVWSILHDEASPESTEKALQDLYDKMGECIFPTGEKPSLTEDERNYLEILESLFFQNVTEFDPLTDIMPIPEEAVKKSRVRDEYANFWQAVEKDHYLAIMRIGREVKPFDLASHTIGVYNVVMHTAFYADKAGFPVDLPLVGAAALCHDIGKIGCRGNDARRVPYLHYYFTWQWFLDNEMESIGHVSANHSTWDLEFENLPIESLLLIYGDFRVRGYRDENGKEHMNIYSLAEAKEIIFSKLFNMTAEKQARYSTVYAKLRDFELLLARNGVPTDMSQHALSERHLKDPSLMTYEEALQGLREMTLSGSIDLMRQISTDRTLETLLETAKAEKNLQRIRTYLYLIEEYNTYMTRANKQKTLLFLYELLMHPEGDVRRMSGSIMGSILANSGPKYRKERPENAKESAMIPTMMALLSESVDLWSTYIDKCLVPDRTISSKHALRIVNCLKNITKSLFEKCEEKEAPNLLVPLLERIYARQGDPFVLFDALCEVPVRYLTDVNPEDLLTAFERELGKAEDVDMMVLRTMGHLMTSPKFYGPLAAFLKKYEPAGFEHRMALTFGRDKLLHRETGDLNAEQVRNIYLSNLKNSVHWTIKLEQMEMLSHHVLNHPWDRLRIAMHLSNIMSVSEHLPVREAAGDCLLKMTEGLKVDQINEIVIDLTRELETGREQISMFIAPYLGRIISRLPDKEMTEEVDQLEILSGDGSLQHARASMRTLGRLMCQLREEQSAMQERILGILLTGVSHYESEIADTSLRVLCLHILGNKEMPMEKRSRLFASIHKKLLTILADGIHDRLYSYNKAAMMNHLYRFIVEREVTCGAFEFPVLKKAAFFPGTFDPFSVGHKQIVEKIRALDYEVYLAVDEFSWSKKTLPNLLRRQIAKMSVADQRDTYIFADNIPINIAIPEDLALLCELLPQKKAALVCGSDVILNASAYRNDAADGAASYDHIVFDRDNTAESRRRIESIVKGRVDFIKLPPFYESVSSTRIRESVDRKLDISMLVAPAVQNLIYDYGLYIRENESKELYDRNHLYFRDYKDNWEEAPEPIRRAVNNRPDAQASALFRRDGELLGWITGRTLKLDDLYDVLHDLEAASYVRCRASGRILLVEEIHGMRIESEEGGRMLLNELLVRSLSDAHTYGLCIAGKTEEMKIGALRQLGFLPLENHPDIFCVDMRSPIMLIQDALMGIKKPHKDALGVLKAFARSRKAIRRAINDMFPEQLILCFDSEILNGAIVERIEKVNGVFDAPLESKELGPYMCVPYGKILAEELVPHTVTKALHVEKCYDADLESFRIRECPGYSPLSNQIRTLKSFRRPIILVDDFLHKSKRLLKMDEVFKEENVEIRRVVVGVMSGRGRDFMRQQNRAAECEYYVPNLRYWFTESILYPFIGGDGVEDRYPDEHLVPSINMILPYGYPNFLRNVQEDKVVELSKTALEGARQIMMALEKAHQVNFNTTLTIGRLSEAVRQPRLPDKGRSISYNFALTAAEYLTEDLLQIRRISRREEKKF